MEPKWRHRGYGKDRGTERRTVGQYEKGDRHGGPQGDPPIQRPCPERTEKWAEATGGADARDFHRCDERLGSFFDSGDRVSTAIHEKKSVSKHVTVKTHKAPKTERRSCKVSARRTRVPCRRVTVTADFSTAR